MLDPSRYQQVIDHPHLVRDKTSGALINTNVDEFEAYRKARDLKLKEQQEKQDLANRISNLENDMSDIKGMLQKLLEKT